MAGLWRACIGVVAVALAAGGCTADRGADSNPQAAAPKREYKEIVGLNLFSRIELPKCKEPGAGEPQEQCWKPDGHRSKQDSPSDDGYVKLMLGRTSVPESTNPEVDVVLWNGKIHSIQVETTMHVDRAIQMLTEKYGKFDRREAPVGESPVYQWSGETTLMALFTNSPSYGEHWILVQSREYTADENERRRAQSAPSF